MPPHHHPTNKFLKAGGVALFMAVASPAYAHVKWFGDATAKQPRAFGEILTTSFWALMALTVFGLLVLTLAQRWVDKFTQGKQLEAWLLKNSNWSPLILRVALFATIVVAWQQHTLFAPELMVSGFGVSVVQFLILITLLSARTTPIAATLTIGLWVYGAAIFGWFPMLDYVNVLGVCVFMVLRRNWDRPAAKAALPILYASLGFSLMWLACEKLVFPHWATPLFTEHPVLSLGLPVQFFLTAAAFVELGLGFALLLGLFGRTLSVVITLTFFLTTMVFGRVEVIGHTLVHGTLVVFLIDRLAKDWSPPYKLHRGPAMRGLFVAANFCLITLGLLFGYSAISKSRAASNLPPSDALGIDIKQDKMSGWNLHITAPGFRLGPPEAKRPSDFGPPVHTHLYIDGEKAARIYGSWHHIGDLPEGIHEVTVELNDAGHRPMSVDGIPIKTTVSIKQPAPTPGRMEH